LKDENSSEGQPDETDSVVFSWKSWMKWLYFVWLNLYLKIKKKESNIFSDYLKMSVFSTLYTLY